ncbi:unnamed protein product, partial [marine sediment metagenome]
ASTPIGHAGHWYAVGRKQQLGAPFQFGHQ